MKSLLLLLWMCGFGLLGFSQDTSKLHNIKTLLEVTGSGNLGVQVATNLVAAFRENDPEVSQEFWDEFMKSIDINALTDLVIPIYDKYYTNEDLLALIAFYQTPAGKKVVAATPQIMRESMQVGEQWGKEVAQNALDSLREKGYLKH